MQWSESLTVAGYEAILNGACRAYPIELRTPFPSLSYDYDAGVEAARAADGGSAAGG